VLDAPDLVANISATAGPSVLNGQSTTVFVTATDVTNQPVPGARVVLSDGESTQTGTTNASGAISFSVIAAGTTTYTAYSGSSFDQVNVIALAPPVMSLALSSSPPASNAISIKATLTDSGGKAVSGQVVSFRLAGGAGPTLSLTQSITNSAGQASVTINTVGSESFVVGATADDSASNASIGLNQPLAFPSLTSARVGQSVSVSGNGFGSHDTVILCWDTASSTPLAHGVANASGRMRAKFKVPQANYGAHSVIVQDLTLGTVAYSSLSVLASLKLNSSRVVPGKTVGATLSGFPASQSVVLKWNSATGTTLTTVSTNGTGAAAATITIPTVTPGKYSVYASATGGPTVSTSLTIK
jgi:hypothetical protein